MRILKLKKLPVTQRPHTTTAAPMQVCKYALALSKAVQSFVGVASLEVSIISALHRGHPNIREDLKRKMV